MPQVSIIIPTYNREKTLKRSIDSVLRQSFSDFELIIVDDCSTDSTEILCNSIDDPRVRYVRHDSNAGACTARNTGIKEAKAEFIAFQDSDDKWQPDKLEKQMREMLDAPEDVGVVYTGFWRYEEGGKNYYPGTRVQTKRGDIHDQLYSGNFVTTQSMLIRRSCFSSVGAFDERLPRLQDWELCLRLSKKYLFSLVDEPLLVVADTARNISSDAGALMSAFEIILDCHHNEFQKRPAILANWFFIIGENLYRAGDAKKSHDYYLKAFRCSPRLMYLTFFVFSFLGSRMFKLNAKMWGGINRLEGLLLNR